MLSILARYNPFYVVDLFNNEKGYGTPKIDVRAAVFGGDQILID